MKEFSIDLVLHPHKELKEVMQGPRSAPAARFSEVIKLTRLDLCSYTPFFLFSHNDFCHFPCIQPSPTPRMLPRRDCLKVSSVIPIYMIHRAETTKTYSWREIVECSRRRQ